MSETISLVSITDNHVESTIDNQVESINISELSLSTINTSAKVGQRSVLVLNFHPLSGTTAHTTPNSAIVIHIVYAM